MTDPCITLYILHVHRAAHLPRLSAQVRAQALHYPSRQFAAQHHRVPQHCGWQDVHSVVQQRYNTRVGARDHYVHVHIQYHNRGLVVHRGSTKVHRYARACHTLDKGKWRAWLSPSATRLRCGFNVHCTRPQPRPAPPRRPTRCSTLPRAAALPSAERAQCRAAVLLFLHRARRGRHTRAHSTPRPGPRPTRGHPPTASVCDMLWLD
jgi:hypothetical protein